MSDLLWENDAGIASRGEQTAFASSCLPFSVPFHQENVTRSPDLREDLGHKHETGRRPWNRDRPGRLGKRRKVYLPWTAAAYSAWAGAEWTSAGVSSGLDCGRKAWSKSRPAPTTRQQSAKLNTGQS